MLASDAEITLEANPEDLVASYVTALVKTAVNRISLGVQSFDDAILRQLGRKHTGAMAKDAILRLQDNGFKSISVDQIVGVPNENVDAILGSLNFLEKNQVGHISSYLLTIEEGTHFHRRNIAPSDEAQADIYLSVQRELSRLGYTQYDISSFAKPHRMSRHNQTYWSGHDYIGLGPGAHSMRKLADGSVERANNHAEIGAWLLYPDNARHFAAEILPPEAALREALAFGLRNMVTGINVPKLALRYQTVVPGSLPTIMAKYSNLGWLGKRGDTYAITPAGALFADAIMRDILCC